MSVPYTTITGYVLLSDACNAVLLTPEVEPYHIPNDIVQKYFLSSGDKLTVRVACSCVTEVISVNGKKEIPVARTKHFDDLPAICIKEKFSLGNIQIPFGRSVTIKTDATEEHITKIQSATKNCGNDIVRITLGIDCRQEEFMELLQTGTDYGYLTDAKQPLKQQLMIILIALYRARDLAETGKRVLFSIISFDKLLYFFNNIIAAHNDIVSEATTARSALSDLEKILYSAKATANGSLTILGTFTPRATENSDRIYEHLTQICDYVI